MATTFTSFGQSIPVLGPGLGFPGTISRQGERVVKARKVVSASNLAFGEPAVLVADTTGGTWQSVKDYIAASADNNKLVGSQFAGIAVRNVQTMLTYPAGVTPGTNQTGYFANGAIGEVLERGSITVHVTNGTPAADGQVYVRVAANVSLTATAVGDIEAAVDNVATTMGSTIGSYDVTVASPTGIVKGQLAVGVGLPDGAVVTGISSSTITLSKPAFQTAASGVAVNFSNTVPLPGVVFTTGVVDADGIAEITLKARNKA